MQYSRPTRPQSGAGVKKLQGALLVAATLTAAIRLRGEPITNSPKVMATIYDSVKLAGLVLRTSEPPANLTGATISRTREDTPVKNAATEQAPHQPLSTSDATDFLIKYKEAWETRNADLAAGLFTRDAEYRQDPFGASIVGREAIHDFWASAKSRQKDIHFTVGKFIHGGYMLAAEWTCIYQDRASDVKKELAGMLFADFYGKQVRHLREYWHSRKIT